MPLDTATLLIEADGGCGMSMQHQRPADERARRLAAANINPATGLASDYLNHFNEAIMLLEMLSSCPECMVDFQAWKPVSYRDHFAASKFRDRALAIEAYDTADPAIRGRLDRLAERMSEILEATRAALAGEQTPDETATVVYCAVVNLKRLVANAGAVINGDSDEEPAPQIAADVAMRR